MPRINSFLLLLINGLTISGKLQCEYEKCLDVLNPGNYVEHTMCRYPPGPSAQCTDVIQKQLNESDETMLLDIHNELRQKVASGVEIRGFSGSQPAGNISNLHWDAKLAEIAQRWADQCLYRSDSCRNFGGYRIGQNVGFISSPFEMDNFSEIVNKWYDEVEQFNPKLISNYRRQGRHMTGHYTQIIWANTTHMGCGGVQYKNSRRRFTAHLVCNYRTEGNINGDAVYDLHL